MKKMIFYIFLLASFCLMQNQLLSAPPTTQAYNIIFAGVTKTAITDIGVTKGDGTGRIIVVYPKTSTPATPVNGTTYTGNTVYGSGTPLGTGYVVYSGTARKTTVSGLTFGTEYTVCVFEYLIDGIGLDPEYKTTIPVVNNPRDVKTVPNAPTSLTVDNCTGVGPTWFLGQWTEPANGKDGYNLYVSTDINFGTFTDMYYPAEVGTGTSLLVEGLTNNTDYYWEMETYWCNRKSEPVYYGPSPRKAVHTHDNLQITGINVTQQVSCYGGSNGSATVTVSGGGTPYSYTWTGGATTSTAGSLSSGTYNVTVRDFYTCMVTSSVVITQPGALTVTAATTDPGCYGTSTGAVNITVGGGTTVYRYNWSNGATTQNLSNVAAGGYTVTVTDGNNCIKTASATLTNPSQLTASITSTTHVSCNGGSNGSATVTAGGGTGILTYSWTGGGTASTKGSLTIGTYTVTVTDTKGCNATASVILTQPNAITVSTSKTDITCNGQSTGAITITAGGGTGTLTYTWSPGGSLGSSRTNLAAGTYLVSVSDANGCGPTTASVILTQPNAITVGTSKTNITCNGQSTGAITITAGGGTGTLTYTWSPGGSLGSSRTNLAAGTYLVSVSDANGCGPTTASVILTQPNAITVSTSKTDITCNGQSTGAITITAGGGTGTLTYTWSPGGSLGSSRTNLAAGTYLVSVSDANGCGPTTASVILTQPNAITVSTSKTDITCNGQSTGAITITAGGGTGTLTYTWSPGGSLGSSRTNLAAGTYLVSVSDANGCGPTTASVILTQPNAITVGTSKTNITCNGQSTGAITITAGGGTGTLTYTWSPGGSLGSSRTNLAAGTYLVSVSDANGCGPTTASVILTQPNAITVSTSKTDITCNGQSTGAITITAGGGTGTLTYTWSPGGSLGSSRTNLAAGTYLVSVSDANGCGPTTASAVITQPSALSVTTQKTDILCNGASTGAVTLTVGGGVPTITYLWSNTATTQNLSNIPAGTYNVTVTDGNGCTKTASAVVSQPASGVTIGGSPTITNNKCNGGTDGSISISVTGGTTPYGYTWSNGTTGTNTISGLAANTYFVSVTDANGCGPKTASYIITQPASAISISTTKTDIVCYGATNGAIAMSVSGGTTGYSYVWSNGNNGTLTGSPWAMTMTGITGGTYVVSVTDAVSCTKTASVVVTQPDLGPDGEDIDRDIIFTNVRATSIDIWWTRSTLHDGSFLIMRQSTMFTNQPIDGQTYTQGLQFSTAPRLCAGCGEKVMYYGTNNYAYVTGLTSITTYYVKVFSYDGDPRYGTGTVDYIQDGPPDCGFNNNLRNVRTPRGKEAPGDSPAESNMNISNFGPNPAVNKINFTIDIQQDGYYNIDIINQVGQKVLSPYHNHMFTNGSHQMEIPFDLASGTYLLKISGGGELIISTFLVVK